MVPSISSLANKGFMWFKKKANRLEIIPALFLHIQKTAGTSLLEVARRHYGNSLTSHGDCWGHAPEKFKNLGFVSGHFGYDWARHLMEGRFSFTFLREPMERVLSMYYFCRNRNPGEFEIYKKAHALGLTEFLDASFDDPWIRKNIWNNQVWQLAHGYGHLDDRTINDFSESELLSRAKENLVKINYVGFVETIEKDGPEIFSDLKIEFPPILPRINKTGERPLLENVSPKVKCLLQEVTTLDRKLYEYAWDIRIKKEAV